MISPRGLHPKQPNQQPSKSSALSPRSPTSGGSSPFSEKDVAIRNVWFSALEINDTSRILQLLSAGQLEDVDIRNEEIQDRTALHLASSQGNETVVMALLDRNASPLLLDRGGWSPLHCALAAGSISIAAILISAGSDCLATTTEGNTVLYYLARCRPDQFDFDVYATVSFLFF